MAVRSVPTLLGSVLVDSEGFPFDVMPCTVGPDTYALVFYGRGPTTPNTSFFNTVPGSVALVGPNGSGGFGTSPSAHVTGASPTNDVNYGSPTEQFTGTGGSATWSDRTTGIRMALLCWPAKGTPTIATQTEMAQAVSFDPIPSLPTPSVVGPSIALWVGNQGETMHPVYLPGRTDDLVMLFVNTRVSNTLGGPSGLYLGYAVTAAGIDAQLIPPTVQPTTLINNGFVQAQPLDATRILMQSQGFIGNAATIVEVDAALNVTFGTDFVLATTNELVEPVRPGASFFYTWGGPSGFGIAVTRRRYEISGLDITGPTETVDFFDDCFTNSDPASTALQAVPWRLSSDTVMLLGGAPFSAGLEHFSVELADEIALSLSSRVDYAALPVTEIPNSVIAAVPSAGRAVVAFGGGGLPPASGPPQLEAVLMGERSINRGPCPGELGWGVGVIP